MNEGMNERISCEYRSQRSELTALESRRYNPNVQNYQWERSTTVGEVLCISTKQGTSGDTCIHRMPILRSLKEHQGRNSSVRGVHLFDFWNVSVHIIAAFSGCYSEIGLKCARFHAAEFSVVLKQTALTLNQLKPLLGYVMLCTLQ